MKHLAISKRSFLFGSAAGGLDAERAKDVETKDFRPSGRVPVNATIRGFRGTRVEYRISNNECRTAEYFEIRHSLFDIRYSPVLLCSTPVQVGAYMLACCSMKLRHSGEDPFRGRSWTPTFYEREDPGHPLSFHKKWVSRILMKGQRVSRIHPLLQNRGGDKDPG
jgi:hypothetical protein